MCERRPSIDFLDVNVIEERTLEVLEEFGWRGELPIDIELLVEKREIYFTFSTELDLLGIESYVSDDLGTIYIDSLRFEQEARCRFTIAHELGHIVLHGDFIRSQEFSTPKEWKIIYDALEPCEESRMETQAGIFASYILIPTESLREQLISYFAENPNNAIGLLNAIYLFNNDKHRESISGMIAQSIAKEFYVSLSAMKWRIYHVKNLVIGILKENNWEE